MEKRIWEYKLDQAKRKLEQTKKDLKILREENAELRRSKLFAYNHIELLINQRTSEKKTKLKVV